MGAFLLLRRGSFASSLQSPVGMLPPQLPKDSPRPPGLIWYEKVLMNPMDNCGVKSVFSGIAGGGMGLMFGMLFSSTPGDLSHIPVPGPDGKYPPPQPFQWKKHFREVGKSAVWYGKSFGTVGFFFRRLRVRDREGAGPQ